MAVELKDLTKVEDNYSKWYNELVVKAGLAENSAVRGCMVIKPYGYAIWEKMQRVLDDMFKQTGHENAYPYSLYRNRACVHRTGRMLHGNGHIPSGCPS